MEQAQALTVLLIETDYSLRRLISLGLQHRGLHVVEASSSDAISSLEIGQIDLLVLDIDASTHHDQTLLTTLASRFDLSSLPAVILSWDEQPATSYTLSSVSSVTSAYAACLEKPFDARVLYSTIDRLLSARALAEARVEAEQEARLLASYNAKTSASIWPVVTAAGLLIAVVGLLFQLLIAAAGLVIVVVALLLWTLGSSGQEVKPQVALP